MSEVQLLLAPDAFFTEHRRWGDLDGGMGADETPIWMTWPAIRAART